METEFALSRVTAAESATRSLLKYKRPDDASWSEIRSSILRAADSLRLLCEQASLPVKLAPIARLRRIEKVRFGCFRGSEASLVPTTSGFTVLLQRDSLRVRQRVSLAHEIGHTFFYDSGSSPPSRLVIKRSISAKEEEICWAFAGELLMPRDSVDGLAQSLAAAHRLAAAREIAHRCDVSIEFALRRLLYNFDAFYGTQAVVWSAEEGGETTVRRYWGKTSRHLLPVKVRQCSDRLKRTMEETRLLGDPAMKAALDEAAEVSRACGAAFLWMSLRGPWGKGIVGVFESQAPTSR